jgi:hypothetical protein
VTKRPGPKPRANKPTAGGQENVTTFGADIRSKIGTQLRAMYADVVKEGVPDRFAELIRQIESKPETREK